MPAVINVGGPVTWGLFVLVSAWAIRAGRALASRRHAHRNEQDDEAMLMLLHDPKACQPQHLQRLSATAIRMLIETVALPCAVLELADGAAAAPPGAGTSSSSSRQQQQKPGSTAVAATAPRILPPELAAAAPCLPVAAWVRALSGGPEAWTAELTRTTAAAASTAAPGPAAATGGAGGALNRLSSQRPGGGGGSSPGYVPPTSGSAPAPSPPNPAPVPYSCPYPPRHALLVVLGRSERSVAAVTAAAAAAGFSRVAVWVGPADSFAAAPLCGPRLPALSRHALWLMLQLGPEPLFHVPSLVLDVRRPDERLLYGAIRGTVNIPADELAAALALPSSEFRRRYGCVPPRPAEGGDNAAGGGTGAGAGPVVVVVHSRSGRRAAWAAQVCVDAGLSSVFVYGEGVCGWRFEDRVKPYRAYDRGATPPEPELISPEEPDEAAGLEELHALGLPLRPGPRPLRFGVGSPPAPAGGAGQYATPPSAVLFAAGSITTTAPAGT